MSLVRADQNPAIWTWTSRPANNEYPGMWKYQCEICGIIVANIELGEDAVCPKDNIPVVGIGTVDVGSIGVEVSIAIPDATPIATEDP